MTAIHSQQVMTKRDAKAIRGLEQLADELREKLALYEAALGGLSAGIDEDSQKLESFGLDARIAEAEKDIAAATVTMATGIVDEMNAVEDELIEDDKAEAFLIEEDEADPEEEGKKLAGQVAQK